MRKPISFGWKVLVFFSLFWTFQECLAGVAVEQVARDQNGVPSKTLLYLSDHQYRTDHQERGLTTVLDFKEDRLVMIDHRSKNYVDVKLSQWERDVARRLKKESPGVKPKKREIIVRKTGKQK